MKTIVLIALCLLLNIGLAQSRLGLSTHDIRKELNELGIKITSGFDSKGKYYYDVSDANVDVRYYFHNSVCDMTLIMPKSAAHLNALVEGYNKRYVIISKTHWRAYDIDGVTEITLIIDETGVYIGWYYAKTN